MNVGEFLNQLRNTDLDDLRLTNIGRWNVALKIVVALLLFVLVLGLYYYFRLKDLNAELVIAQERETALRQTYEERAFEAANLEAYRLQMRELEIRLDALIEQLPNETEVPGLLEDITETGISSGLQISSIELQAERPSDYYVELPIRFVATGGYHDFATFVSGVAGLPRIVTMHDFDISPVSGGGGLELTLDAKTYRYRSPEEGQGGLPQ